MVVLEGVRAFELCRFYFSTAEILARLVKGTEYEKFPQLLQTLLNLREKIRDVSSSLLSFDRYPRFARPLCVGARYYMLRLRAHIYEHQNTKESLSEALPVRTSTSFLDS